MKQDGKDINSCNVYLRDGVTWSRLKLIASQAPAVGGLGLMTYGSTQYHQFFSSAPPAMIDERPECTALFLKWLLPRQRQLGLLA